MSKPLADKIRAIRNAMGLNQAEFGEKLGTNQSTVTRWERGAMPKGEALRRLADLANTSVERLLNVDDLAASPADELPIVGYVGAGATVLPIDDFAMGDGLGYIERPEFVHGRAVAVEVRGDSLFPTAEDGWRLVYTDEKAMNETEVLGKLCVVQLEDERILVKRISRGSKPQHYHLLSTNAPAIEDVRIVWAARVKAIVPR